MDYVTFKMITKNFLHWLKNLKVLFELQTRAPPAGANARMI